MYPTEVMEAIEGIKERDYSFTVNSVWGVVNKNGKLEKCGHTNCFAATTNVKTGSKYFINRVQHNGICQMPAREKYKKDLIKFYDLLFNESTWADVFITKSGEEVMETGYMVARTDVPSNMLIQAMQAARIPTEYSNTMWAWIDLSEAGVNPKLAFLIAMCMRGGDRREGTVDFRNTSSNHRCLDVRSLSAQKVKAMVEVNPHNPNPNFTEDTNYYSPNRIERLWGSYDDDDFRKFIVDNFNPEDILGNTGPKVCLNPFKRPEPRVEEDRLCEYSVAIKAMVIFSKEIEEEFLNA